MTAYLFETPCASDQYVIDHNLDDLNPEFVLYDVDNVPVCIPGIQLDGDENTLVLIFDEIIYNIARVVVVSQNVEASFEADIADEADVVYEPAPSSFDRMDAFRRDLEDIINRHSMENLCDMPDYMMAEHLCDYIGVLANTVRQRDKWFGFTPFGNDATVLTPAKEGKVTREMAKNAVRSMSQERFQRSVLDEHVPTEEDDGNEGW